MPRNTRPRAGRQAEGAVVSEKIRCLSKDHTGRQNVILLEGTLLQGEVPNDLTFGVQLKLRLFGTHSADDIEVRQARRLAV